MLAAYAELPSLYFLQFFTYFRISNYGLWENSDT
jgi:hypothetical protein